jgi:hypothetical protein
LSALAVLLGATVLPASAVELGGKQVPKDKFIIFVLIGHSNSMGYGTKKGPLDTQPAERCWYFDNFREEVTGADGKKSRTTISKWVPSREDIIPPERHACPGHRFMKYMAAAYPDYHFGLIQESSPGAVIRFYLESSKAKPGEEGKKRPDDQADLRTPLEQKIAAVKDHGTFGGVLCFLGYPEGKAKYGMGDVDNYVANLAKLQEELRGFIGVSDLPFILGLQEVDAPEKRQHSPKILEWILAQPDKDPRKRTLLTPEKPMPRKLYGDQWHYNVSAYEVWTSYAARKYQDNGWDTWFKGGKKTLVEPLSIDAALAGADVKPADEKAKPANNTTKPADGKAKPAQADTKPAVGSAVWPKAGKNLAFAWNDPDGTRLPGDDGLLCTVTPRGLARYTRTDGMLIDGGSFVADVSKAFPEPVTKAKALTVDVSVFFEKAPTGEGLIVGLYEGKTPTLEVFQKDDQVSFRTRTAAAEGAPAKERTVHIGKLTPGAWHQVVVQVTDNAPVMCYLDGQKADFKQADPALAELRNGVGKPDTMLLGARPDGSMQWAGEIENVAVWRSVTTPGDVKQNKTAADALRAARKPTSRIVVEAKLLEVSDATKNGKPVIIDSTYPRLLSVAHYEVTKLLSGKLDAKKVLVAHWAKLDQKEVAAHAARKVGQSYTLTLEPLADHDEVSGDQRVETVDVDLDTPIMLDMTALAPAGK